MLRSRGSDLKKRFLSRRGVPSLGPLTDLLLLLFSAHVRVSAAFLVRVVEHQGKVSGREELPVFPRSALM